MSFGIVSKAERKVYVPGERVTEQSHAGHTSVQFIIDQFTRTGVLMHNKEYEDQYGEQLSADLYELAQTKVAEANSFFESLPEGIRQDFPGGTQQFLEFSQDPNNIEKMEAYGLPTAHLGDVDVEPLPGVPETPETPTATAQELSEQLNTPKE